MGRLRSRGQVRPTRIRDLDQLRITVGPGECKGGGVALPQSVRLKRDREARAERGHAGRDRSRISMKGLRSGRFWGRIGGYSIIFFSEHGDDWYIAEHQFAAGALSSRMSLGVGEKS